MRHGGRKLSDYFVFNTDHKVIGIQYMVVAFIFFIIGGLMAEAMRTELALPEHAIRGRQQLQSALHPPRDDHDFPVDHPGVCGPGQLRRPADARRERYGLPEAERLLVLADDSGRDLADRKLLRRRRGKRLDGLSAPQLADAGRADDVGDCASVHRLCSIFGAINFLVTIFNMRAPGMTLMRLPLLAWAMISTSIIIILGTPVLSAALAMLTVERLLGATFFSGGIGGDPLMWQNLFWFYSHPAVYIMILPGFGIISEVIPVFSRKPIFGYKLIAFSGLAIAIFGFLVWAHHMFTSGMDPFLRVPFMITSMIIAVPTGVKIFSWLATMWGGKLRFTTPMMFALAFISMFVIGGISGVFLASVPIDIHVQDTYFVVAHLHYVLFGGSVMAIYAGVYFWYPKITGRMYSERLGKLHFWMTFIGFNITFLPQHVLGLQGMPRRVADYSPEFMLWNLVSTLGSFLLGRQHAAVPVDGGRELFQRQGLRAITRGARSRSTGP